MNTLKLQYLSRTERNPKATTLTWTPMPTLSIKLTKQNSFYWHSDFSLGCYVWLKIGQKSKDLKKLSIYFLLISFFASTRLWPFIFIKLKFLETKDYLCKVWLKLAQFQVLKKKLRLRSWMTNFWWEKLSWALS